MTILRYFVFCFLLAGCVSSGACASSYQLRGRVVEGPTAEVRVVRADNASFSKDASGGGGALVWAVWEPGDGINRKRLGQFTTDENGFFSIPIDEAGAGFLIYEMELTARWRGHQGVMQTIRVPGPGKRVLITLPRGVDTLRRPDDVLERTLRDAEPYLDGRR